MSTDSHTHGNIPEIDAAEASRLVASGDVLLLDVRENDEWTAGHAAEATHLRLGEVTADRLIDDQPVIAVCRSGKRSAQAAATLKAAGVHVHNLTGGMTAWANAGLPVVTDDGGPGTIA